MENIKNVNTSVKDRIEKFIAYYDQKAEYLKESNKISSGRIEDFNNWYNKTARSVFNKIKRSVRPDADEERISALIAMLIFIIDKSIMDDDYERLIDNLYFVPDKMKLSFEKFNLIDKKQIFEDTINLSSAQTNKTFWGFKVNYDYISGDPKSGSPVSQIKPRYADCTYETGCQIKVNGQLVKVHYGKGNQHRKVTIDIAGWNSNDKCGEFYECKIHPYNFKKENLQYLMHLYSVVETGSNYVEVGLVTADATENAKSKIRELNMNDADKIKCIGHEKLTDLKTFTFPIWA